jgi:hypothetical protein
VTDELAVWKPDPFKGSDLLPAIQPTTVGGVPLVGRDAAADDDEMPKIPMLKLIQGTSPELGEGIDGLAPGKFFLTSTREVIEPPIRTLIIAHHRSNAMYPREGDSRYAGLEQCISRDGVVGDKYGSCDKCGRHRWPKTKWGERADPPLCAGAHNFIVLTDRGPAKIRFRRKSYPAGNNFYQTWRSSPKNLWHHPVEIRVIQETKTLDSGAKANFFKLGIAWRMGEQLPEEAHKKAYETYQLFEAALMAGEEWGEDDE